MATRSFLGGVLVEEDHVHCSAKRLDFKLVYLKGVDRIIPKDETRERLTRLLYVATTRAKYRLVIPYVNETEFIGRLKKCLP